MVGFFLQPLSNDVTKWFTYVCPAYRLLDFMIGCNVGYAFIHGHSSKNRTAVETIVLIIVSVQIWIYNQFEISEGIRYTFYWMPMNMLLIYLGACQGGKFTQFLASNKVLIWIGNRSGEAFLIHQIVIKFVNCFTEKKILLAIVSFLLTIIAVVIWELLYARIKTSIKRRGIER
mgnify:CR=1 FL=1